MSHSDKWTGLTDFRINQIWYRGIQQNVLISIMWTFSSYIYVFPLLDGNFGTGTPNLDRVNLKKLFNRMFFFWGVLCLCVEFAKICTVMFPFYWIIFFLNPFKFDFCLFLKANFANFDQLKSFWWIFDSPKCSNFYFC